MNIIQKLLRALYPLRMKISELTGLGKKRASNKNMKTAPVSFYGLQAVLNNGKPFDFQSLKGKYVLLVNTASNCGFTQQYDDLEKLSNQYTDQLVVLGFPSNDFGAQEPGDDTAIEQFCRINFGVTFPLFKKDSVKGQDKQPLYKWLSDPALNGWNVAEPTWNFCKYLMNPEGVLLEFYTSAVSPLDAAVTGHLNSK